MKYILALDIGIASVGWAVLDKESETVIEAGSNIFPEASAAEKNVLLKGCIQKIIYRNSNESRVGIGRYADNPFDLDVFLRL